MNSRKARQLLPFRALVISVCLTLIVASLGLFAPGKAHAATVADDAATIRTTWLNQLTGGTITNSTSSDIAAKIASINSNAEAVHATMDTSASRTYIFSTNTTQFPTSNITATYQNLYKLALAVKTPGGTHYNDAQYISDITSALDWLYANWYSDSIATPVTYTPTVYNNWFDWELGVPMAFDDTMVLMYDNLTSAQLTNYTNAINHFTKKDIYHDGSSTAALANPTTGTNRAWRARAMLGSAIMTLDATTIQSIKDALPPLYNDVSIGDGVYDDGSVVFHTANPYTYGYGTNLLFNTAFVIRMLKGTQWEVTDNNRHNLVNWLYNSFEPYVFGSKVIDNTFGRTISRTSFDDHADRALVSPALLLADSESQADASRIDSLIKYVVNQDADFSYTTYPFTLGEVDKLISIRGDATIAERGDVSFYKQFPAMDRVIQEKPNYAFGVSMSSDSTFDFESGNGENMKGWHTGDGRTELMMKDDPNQVSDQFYPTVDMYRLPGTTAYQPLPEEITSPEIGEVQITADTNIDDTLDDFSKVYDKTPYWGLTADTPANFGNDASRAVRTQDVRSTITYNASNITNLQITVYYNGLVPLNYNYVGYSAGADGVFGNLPLKKSSAVATAGGWYKVTLSNSGTIPAGTNYVKIEFGGNHQAPDSFNTTTDVWSGSDKNWAGGAEIEGLYGATGMQLSPNTKSLQAKKSWFMLDNEIVALGADINSSDGRDIQTIVENRKIDDAGDNALTVNGTAKPTTLGWNETMTGVNWMHLAGSGTSAGSDIGYYFPGGSTVNGLREARTGLYSAIDENNRSTTSYTKNYMTLWFDHGVNPTGGTYSYVLLPGMSASQVQTYSASPDVTILANSSSVQSVYEKNLDLTAANFWTNTSTSVAEGSDPTYLTSNSQTSVLVKKNPYDIDISVADPRNIPAQLTPLKDTYTTQNNPSQEHGSENNIHVLGTTGTNNEIGYLSLDLHRLKTAGITSAKLRLYGQNVTDSTSVGVNVLEAATDSWKESGVTWNSPLATTGSSLGTITFNGTAQYAEVDLTSFIQSKIAAGDYSVTLVLQDLSNTGKEVLINSTNSGVNEPMLTDVYPSTATITLDEPFAGVVTSDPQITVSGNATSTTLTVNTLGTNGASLKAKLIRPTSPTDDAFTYKGSSTTNYNLSYLQVKGNSTGSADRESYLKFNLSGLDQIGSAKLRLYGSNLSDTTAVPISAFGTSSNTWSETTLTYSNAPPISGTAVSTTNVNNTAQYYEWDVTSLAQASLAGDHTFTVELKDASDAQKIIQFNSKEASANKPMLVIQPKVSLTSEADANTWKANPDTNYNYTYVQVKGNTTGTNDRKGYVRFDLTSIPSVSNAKLRIYAQNVSDSTNVTLSLGQTASDTWDERSITYNNAPAIGSTLGTLVANGTAAYVDVDVTSYVQSILSGDRKASFVIWDAANTGKIVNFFSKENSSNPPQLLITE